MNIPSLKIKYNTERERRRHILLADRREALNNSLCESGKRIIILSSDCVGGRILHDFELPEYTPTINNWYSAEDFLKICSNPDYYFSQDVEYTGEDQNNEPTGRCGDIVIHFGHSSGFEESLKKWKVGCKSYFRAKKKGNYEICVIMNDRNSFKHDMIEEFEQLPYKNKVLFVHRREWNRPSTFYMMNEDNRDYVDIMTGFENSLSV